MAVNTYFAFQISEGKIPSAVEYEVLEARGSTPEAAIRELVEADSYYSTKLRWAVVDLKTKKVTIVESNSREIKKIEVETKVVA